MYHTSIILNKNLLQNHNFTLHPSTAALQLSHVHPCYFLKGAKSSKSRCRQMHFWPESQTAMPALNPALPQVSSHRKPARRPGLHSTVTPSRTGKRNIVDFGGQ